MNEGTGTSPWWDSSEAVAAAGAYAQLERQMRAVIDRVGRAVCPGCGRLCCRGYYCRATATNPWYGFVHETAACPPLPGDAAARRDPFALGPDGCELRAGRYVFCYSYNCPVIQRYVGGLGVGREFQELSDLLLSANRLPGGRFLHELGPGEDLDRADLQHIADETRRATRIVTVLLPLLDRALDPSRRPGLPQAEAG